jgi:hypothetical protein
VTITAYDQSHKRTTVDTRIVVRKADQGIAGPAHLPAATYGDPPRTISATADSGLPVDVRSLTPRICATSGTHGTTIAFLAPGDCRLLEHQAGDITYNPATEGRLITVGPASATAHITPAAAQFSDPVPDLHVLGQVTGLVGSDTLSGSVSGCTAAGLGTAAGVVTSPAGSYALTGCTGLSNSYYTVDYTGALTVNPEDATLTPTSPSYVPTAPASAATATVPLSVSVSQADDGHLGDLTNAHVDFLVWGSANDTTTPDYTLADVPVDASGTAATTAQLPPGAYRYTVRLSDNRFYTAPPGEDSFVVFQPKPGTRAGGGGWVLDPGAAGNHKAQFDFNVTNDKTGATTGAVSYSWLDAGDGYTYTASCSDWSGGGLLVADTNATIACRGSLTAVNPATGTPVPGLGGAGYSIVLKVTDNGTGKADTLSLTLETPGAAPAHTVATASGGQLNIGGGNVTVQTK